MAVWGKKTESNLGPLFTFTINSSCQVTEKPLKQRAKRLEFNHIISGVICGRWTYPLQGHSVLLPHGLFHDRVLWVEKQRLQSALFHFSDKQCVL